MDKFLSLKIVIRVVFCRCIRHARFVVGTMLQKVKGVKL